MASFRLFGLALLVVVAASVLECLSATGLTVTVYSEVPCAKGAAVSLVGGSSASDLPSRAISAVSMQCDDARGLMGNVVVLPAGSKDENVAFALMQRPDGQPADACLDPTQASGCIVAKRQLRFEPHLTSDMRVDLRLSCLGVLCPADQTCVKGTCVSATTTCGASCDEGSLGGEGLLSLSLSAGTLSPAFDQATLGYGVVSSIVSVGAPFTVTPTYSAGYSVSVNGAAVASGAPSPAIPLGLLTPTPIDVALTSPSGASTHYAVTVPPTEEAYVKASNARAVSYLGYSIALAGDTLAVGALEESSNATGVGGNQADTSAPASGAVYVFTRTGSTWSQQAYLKASNTRPSAQFGVSLALSGDTLAVGSPNESSNATGIGGNQADTSAALAGAVYVFVRSGTAWSQQAYVKASNTRANALFGTSVGLSGDTLAVGSSGESSNATGTGGNQADASASGAGAAYVFVRSGSTWSQEAYLKASNTRSNAQFGFSVALSGDTLVVGSPGESSNATGIGGNQADTGAANAGAVYVFARSGVTWTQQAYVKASNTRNTAAFGASIALSADTLAVGSPVESSKATGVDGSQGDTSAFGAGAVYVFARTGTTWAQQAYVKASNTRASSAFGDSIALFGDLLAVAAPNETSNATGVNGNQADTSLMVAGAVYLFTRSSATWSQLAYVKASNTSSNLYFGTSVTVSADTLAVGEYGDSSSATGINGNQADTSANFAGAAFVLR